MRRASLLIFVIALLVRLAYVGWAGQFYPEGVGELRRAAVSLATTGVLGNVYASDSGPSAHCSPAYPVILAGIYRASGVGSPMSRWLTALLVSSASALSICLLAHLASALRLSRPVQIGAPLLAALSPFNLWIETSGMWEQPLSALCLVATVILFLRLKSKGWRAGWGLLAFTLLVGVAALLAPPVLLAAACMLLAEVVTNDRERHRAIAATLLAVAVTAALVVPWGMRNRATLGKFIPFRSNFGLELSLENHDTASGVAEGWLKPPKAERSNIPQHPFSNELEREEYRRMGEVAYMAKRGAAARDWIRSHPVQFAKLCLNRARLFWFPPSSAFRRDTPLLALRPAVAAMISLLALARLVLMLFQRDPARWTMIAAIAGYAAIYLITHVALRYTYPIFGISLVLATDAALQAATRVRQTTQIRARVPENSRVAVAHHSE